MKNSPFLLFARLLRLLAMWAAATLANPAARADTTTTTTEPVGFVTLNCLGNSDSIMSLPLYRMVAFTGGGLPSTTTTSSFSESRGKAGKGTVIGATTTTTKITFTGAPFTASQYKHVSGTQPDTFYALFVSGPKAGCFYTITDNDTGSVTIDPNGDDLSATTSAVPVKIIPYWTLNTVFPGGSGVTASSGFTSATQIVVPNSTGVGINLASSEIYYYLASAGGAWYNTATGAVANEAILYPDRYFIVRNNRATATAFTVVGAVAISTLSIPIATSSAGQQDNPVAITRAMSMSLNDSGLVSSGAFSASSGFIAGDQLFAFDNSVASLNKAATTVYTYVGGAWQKSGNPADAGGELVFTPGMGVIIRKAPKAGGATLFWINPSTYSN